MVHIEESHKMLKDLKDHKLTMVVIESRFSAENTKELVRNKKFTLACMRDCFLKGESPYASHVIYAQTHVLDDFIAHERALGIHAGLQWGNCAEKTIVYTDLGISAGMKIGIEHAEKIKRPVEYRTLGYIPEVTEKEIELEKEIILNQKKLLEELKNGIVELKPLKKKL